MIVPRSSWKWPAAAVLLFLAAALAAPFVRADRYGQQISAALESSLGRKVKIGAVRFDLLRGPGFTIRDVEIAENPAFGIETFVWLTDTLDVRLRLSSLITGRLEFSSIRLNAPVVNLVKSDSGRWNFEELLAPKVVASLPRIEVAGGRVNFKFGDRKTVFYIGNVDLDATVRGGAVPDWDISFSAEPARTDRVAPLYRQSVAGSGRWRADRVALDLELERSALSELSAVLFGRDAGVHGMVSSRVRLAGPPEAVEITGRLEVEELHRWDQMPMKGDGWPLDFRGSLDITRQELKVESRGPGVPIAVRYRVSDYLGSPRWAVGLSWTRFPAGPLTELARHMGAPLPEDLKLSGALDGAVNWTRAGGLQGTVALHEAAIGFRDTADVSFDEARVLFDGDRIALAPALARTAEKSQASVGAEYRWATGELDLNISSDSMTIADIRKHAARLPAPLLAAIREGAWRGKLRYRRGPGIEEGWSGQAQLQKAEIPLPGFAEPILVRSAAARLDGARLWVDRLDARIGGIDLHGEYRYEPAAARPHRFRLAIPSAGAAEVERLLMPTLRRREGFLARTLGIGRAGTPAWLAQRFMDGSVEIGELTLGGAVLTGLRSRVRWNGPSVELSGLQARLENGEASGRLIVDLRGPSPLYQLNYYATSLDYRGGKLNAEGVIETSGTGAELLARARSDGSFSGVGFGEAFQAASGCYRLEARRLRFTELQIDAGGELYIGRGATQDDGSLLLQLSAGSKQMRISGPLAQLVVE